MQSVSYPSPLTTTLSIPPIQPEIIIPDPLTPQQAVDALLAQNLDVVSLPAVSTLLKYIQNILANPLISKYRAINTANKTFQAKIAAANGAIAILFAAGFSFSDNHIAPSTATMLVYKYPVSDEESYEVDIVIEELELLFCTQEVLLAALGELGEQKDLPAMLSRDFVSQQMRAVTSPTTVVTPPKCFDPFTATVVRTNPQPVRIDSELDRQLSELQQRKALLEGSPQDVQRLTAVLFPAEESNSKGLAVPVDEAVQLDSTSNKGLIKQLLARKQEDAPLTTKVQKDLQRLQKERVYSKTLVKVRFPDRVTLQGYFHPRHSLQDVCEWLLQSFNSNDDYHFDLYTSPPRQVIASYPVTKSSTYKAEQKTLSDMGFTPAVLIHLSWQHTAGVKSSSLASDPQNNVGLYLRDDLLSMGRGEDLEGSGSKNASLLAFPVSESLVTSSNKGDVGLEAHLKGSVTMMDDSIAGGDGLKKGKKPKWFKI